MWNCIFSLHVLSLSRRVYYAGKSDGRKTFSYMEIFQAI